MNTDCMWFCKFTNSKSNAYYHLHLHKLIIVQKQIGTSNKTRNNYEISFT